MTNYSQEDFARAHSQQLIRVGGLFKTREVARGKHIVRELVTGSGGATCFPQGPDGWVYSRRCNAWAAVNLCAESK